MPAYSTEDVLCMRSYLDWLETRDKTLRLPFTYTGGDMPENWRECLQLNFADLVVDHNHVLFENRWILLGQIS